MPLARLSFRRMCGLVLSYFSSWLPRRSVQASAEAEREAKKAAARFASTNALDGGGGKRART